MHRPKNITTIKTMKKFGPFDLKKNISIIIIDKEYTDTIK